MLASKKLLLLRGQSQKSKCLNIISEKQADLLAKEVEVGEGVRQGHNIILLADVKLYALYCTV